MIRSAAVVLAFLMCLSLCFSQQTPDQVVDTLRKITATDAGEWRFQHPAQPGGELPATDDSGWLRVRPEHEWQGDRTAAWYRRTIVIPDNLGGVSLAGSSLTLRCAVDDDMEIFINGEPKGRFHWDQGQVVLTEKAQAGERFLVAIKALNQGGPGRLLWVSLSYDRLERVREPAEQALMRLQFAQQLLSAGDRRISADAARYNEALAAAAGKIDFAAINRDDVAAFTQSVADLSAALQPFSDLAKQYSLYLVGHAHIDMNWLWLWPETKEVCRLTWTQALKFMDEWPDFRFTQSQPGAYLAIEQEQPELFKRIQAAVKAGQWEPIGAGWVESDMNMVSGEALARHCLMTDRYYQEKFGVRSHTGWYPDTFGHAWTVPSILSDGGIQRYYFCRCGKGYPLFTWEGPDGARLTAYNYGGYGEQMRPDRAGWPLEVERRVGAPEAMLVYGVGDHGGGPTRTDVEWAKKLQQEPLFPQVKFAKTSDYFDAVGKSGAKPPVVKDELNFTFEGCYTTHADIKLWNRQGENSLPTAEALATVAGQWGVKYPSADLLQGWRNTCFNQFHDIFDGSAIHDSYLYSKQLHEQTQQVAQKTIGDSLAAVAGQVDTRGNGQAVLLWNPVAWERRDFVRVVINSARRLASVAVVDDRGKTVPTQILDSTEGEGGWATTVGFIADVPAMGYAVYHVAEPPGPESESGHAAAGTQLHPTRPLRVRPELQVLHEAPLGMSAWNIGRITDTQTLQAEGPEEVVAGPVCARRTATYRFGNSTMKLVTTTYTALPRTDFDLDVDWQEVGNGRDGGAFLKAAFVTDARQPRATFSIPWGSIERACNGQEVPGQEWIDLAETRQVLTPGSRPARAIDLSKFLNLDAVATVEQPTDGDFDKGERAYPAEIFGEKPGAKISVAGVPFKTPPLEHGAKNAVAAEGQTLTWPAERAEALAVLGASSNGRHGGTARLLYEGGREESVPLEFSDWCFGPGPSEVDALKLDYRLGTGGKIEPPVHVWMRQLPVDGSRALRGIVLPKEPNLKVFGLAFAAKIARVDQRGVSLLNDCKYGFDVNGGTMRMSLLRTSYDPDPRPDQGQHHIRYALVPHEGDWRSAETPRRAQEFNSPIIAVPVEAHAGKLPGRCSFVRVEPANMVLTALKPAEDGQGVIARVYNSTGVGGTATITCRLPFRRATACNLLEEPRAKNGARVRGSTVTLDLQGRLQGSVRLE